jgi:hypothetical protein
MIDSIAAATQPNNKKGYGPTLCKHPFCANMRLYDGRYHGFQAVLDATIPMDAWSPGKDWRDLAHKDKSFEFSQDRVRMVSMLQARTPFRSRNIEICPTIHLQEYMNMYEQKTKSNV